jgi:CubicO group peptidase (beta-lactamase class C family)
MSMAAAFGGWKYGDTSEFEGVPVDDQARTEPERQSDAAFRAVPPAAGLTRRTVLKGVGLAGVAAGLPGWAASRAEAKPRRPDPWGGFDRAVRAGFDRMQLVGSAIAVVSADRVLHTVTLGSRSLRPRGPVTENTRFVVASTTKAMTSALVATYVDEGTLGWDQKVIDAWSGFRAPTDELTRTLRVRDLLGMATGIQAPLATDFHLGEPTAAEGLQSLVSLPVVDRPGEKFFYINGVYAAGGYLPLLATGVAPADLSAAYAQAMRDRVFRPAGMTGAWIGADPRELVNDYASGYGFDLRPQVRAMPFAAFGSTAPSSSALASLRDMAAFVRMQLRQGVSAGGGRVVSAANLTECWKPGVSVPVAETFDPDAMSKNYAMGWFREEFKDGSTLLHHGGNVDGFSLFMAFLPQHDLGLVVLNNMDSVFADPYVLNVMLNQRLGLNLGVPAKVLAFSDSMLDDRRRLGRLARPVNIKAVASHLGYYEKGYSLVLEGRGLQLRLGPRVWPLLLMPDGRYVISEGVLATARVDLAQDADGVPRLEIVGFETVRRTTGLGCPR